MQYIVEEIVINKIHDAIIENSDEKLDLLKTIKEKNIEFAISLKKKIGYEDRVIYYPKVRLLSFQENKLNIISINDKANLIIKDIFISDVVMIKVYYDKNKIFYKQDNIDRTDLLDFN
jgi:aspartyl/asparaginyl-tRNA synthetase